METKNNKQTNPEEEILQVEMKPQVPADKFDKHMKRARKNDQQSHRKVFLNQSKADDKRDSRISDIKPSVY